MNLFLNFRRVVFGLACLVLLASLPLKADTTGTDPIPGLLMKPEVRALLEQQRVRHFLPTPEVIPDEEEGVEEDTVKGQLRLSAIINSNGRRQAIINGQVFNEREEKEGIQVHRIFSNYVTLTTLGQWGRLELGMTYELFAWPNRPENNIKVGN